MFLSFKISVNNSKREKFKDLPLILPVTLSKPKELHVVVFHYITQKSPKHGSHNDLNVILFQVSFKN